MVRLQDACEAGPNVNGVTGSNSGTNILTTNNMSIYLYIFSIWTLGAINLSPDLYLLACELRGNSPLIPNWAIEKNGPFFGCLAYIREILPSYTGIIKSTTFWKGIFRGSTYLLFFSAKRDVGRLVFAQAIFAWSWLFQDWQDWVRSPMLGCFLVGRNDDLLDAWLGVRSSRWRSYI